MRTALKSLSLAVLLAACGGSDDAPAASRDDDAPASPDDDQLVGELDRSGRTALCEWLRDLGDPEVSEEQYCTQQASEGADETVVCEEQRDACLEATSEPDEVAVDCSRYVTPEDCLVPVSELKSCLGALRARLGEAVRRATCEDPSRGRVEFPEQCERLPDGCFRVTGASAAP